MERALTEEMAVLLERGFVEGLLVLMEAEPALDGHLFSAEEV